jgi:hypothetical protein
MATNRSVIPTNRMPTAPSAAAIGGLFLAVQAAVLLVLLYHFQSNPQFAAVLALLLGFSAVSAVRLMQQRPVSDRAGMRITFNEGALHQQIAVIFNQMLPQPERDARDLRWEVQAHDLIGMNNGLALAKVRLDLERELRRLIDESNIEQPRLHSVRYYAEALMNRHIIPPEIVQPIFEVSRVANAAVHGADVTTDIAAGAVRVGEDIVEILRALPGRAA